jgi:branched-chain amino acid transport system substrate-binding protein
MRQSWRLLLSIALVMGSVQAVSAQEQMKFGVVGPHSGPAPGGQSTLLGAKVAAAEINAAGGLLNGRKIEIVTPIPAASPPSRSARTGGL